MISSLATLQTTPTTTPYIPLITRDNHADRPLEDVGNGALFQWLDGGRILYTRMANSSRATWDSWAGQFYAMQAHWPADRKRLYVWYDLTDPKFGVTLYMSQQVRQLMLVKRPYQLFGALLLANNAISSLITYTLRSNRHSEHTNFAFYTEREKSRVWLYDRLTKNGDN